MNSTPSLRRAVLVLLALTALFATAGCVNLPANTTVSVVGNPAKAGNGADVRIWPQAPQSGASPEQTVEDFLQTAASDPSNRSIAAAYLAGEALNNWNPNKVVVFSDVSSPAPRPSQTSSDRVQVDISGTEVATVSENGVYQQVLDPIKGATYTFGLSYNPAKHYYQIDRLPNAEFGILLNQETFRAKFSAYYLYYLNQDTQTPSMIPVPNYQRSQTNDAATAQNLLNALLTGPPDALNGIATLAAPQADVANQVTISQDDTASVLVKAPGTCKTAQGRSACKLLADELLATFSSLASVSKVTLVDAQGNPLAYSSSVDSLAGQYHITPSPAKSTSFYYLDAKTHLINRYDGADNNSDPVSVEQLGPATRKYSELAVWFDGQQTQAAAVDDKKLNLYVGTPGSSKDTAPIFIGHRIVSPTWDALGHLWFLDVVGPTTLLYRLDFTAEPKPSAQLVALTGDGSSIGTINEIAAAPDGRRIAVSYAGPGATPGPAVDSVAIATVRNTATGLEANLSYGIDQPVVYHWTWVLDVCWHGSQALAVLGSATPSSPVTISELNSDGSPVVSAADLNPVTFNPPTSTNSIEWTGATLLAGTRSGTGNSTVLQVEQYSSTTGTWSVAVNGFSPTYM